MNCASARCRRASSPRSTVKRAPESFEPVSPSSQPLRAPSSTWSLTAKSNARGVPQRCCSTLCVSSLPTRHRCVGEIRNAERDVGEPRLHLGEPVLVGLELVADAGDFGHQRRCVLAFAFRDADRLRARVAQVLQLLRLGLRRSCARLRSLRSRPCRACSRARRGVRPSRRAGRAAGRDRACGGVRENKVADYKRSRAARFATSAQCARAP